MAPLQNLFSFRAPGREDWSQVATCGASRKLQTTQGMVITPYVPPNRR